MTAIPLVHNVGGGALGARALWGSAGLVLGLAALAAVAAGARLASRLVLAPEGG